MTERAQARPQAAADRGSASPSSRGRARARRPAEAVGEPPAARRTPVTRGGRAWRGLVPERVEAIEVVHRALERLEDSRGVREVEEALSRLGAAVDLLGQRVSAAEERTRIEASERVEGVRARWAQVRDALQSGGPLPTLDGWLSRLGLMRLTAHQRELETARRHAQRAGARKARAALRRAAASGADEAR